MTPGARAALDLAFEAGVTLGKATDAGGFTVVYAKSVRLGLVTQVVSMLQYYRAEYHLLLARQSLLVH